MARGKNIKRLHIISSFSLACENLNKGKIKHEIPRDWESCVLLGRKGASTVEYIMILAGILGGALILSKFMAHDGQLLLKDKIIAIINGSISGEKENENALSPPSSNQLKTTEHDGSENSSKKINTVNYVRDTPHSLTNTSFSLRNDCNPAAAHGCLNTKREKVEKEKYDELWDAVAKTYPGSRLRVFKRSLVERVLKEERDSIIAAGEKYDVPPEIIASIIVKEQITQSAPDWVNMMDTYVRGKGHSVGLGAIFPSTAQKVWDVVNPEGGKKYGIVKGGDTYETVKILADNDEANIHSIAVVLKHKAQQLYGKSVDLKELTEEQWRAVIGKYNAESPEKKNYSDKTVQYPAPTRSILGLD